MKIPNKLINFFAQKKIILERWPSGLRRTLGKCVLSKVHITSKTKNKLYARLTTKGALFSVYRHSVFSLLAFYYEKN